MNKKLLPVFVALVTAVLALDASAQAPQAYATLSNFTLHFYYDTQRDSHSGATVYDVPLETSKEVRTPWEYNDQIKTVVFDASFADFKPLSTAYWFEGLSGLDSIHGLQYLNTDEVTNMSFMFTFCKALKEIDVSNFNTSNVTDMHDMFSDCESVKKLDLSNFDTRKVTTMYDMFGDCMRLETLNVSSFNTDNVTDMGFMFCNCTALDSLDLTNFNTKKVTAMNWMLAQCSSLKKLDLTNFNTLMVTDMDRMLKDCSQLTTIYCNDDWSEGEDKVSIDMFWGCTQLVGAVPYNEVMVGVEMANPTKGYFTTKEPSAIGNVAIDMTQTKVYNLNGQPVGDDYQGIVIKDGKKILQQ